MKKYKYKNIILFQVYGSWQADYYDGEKRFALHRMCAPTKKSAYAWAKFDVDYMNEKK